MTLKTKILLIFLILFIGFFLGLFFYQKKNIDQNKKSDLPYPKYALSETLRTLNQNSEYLESSDFEKLKPHEYIEYFRQGLIVHKYSADPKKEFGLEIEKNFPGESGKTIVQLYKAYIDYMNFLSLVEKNKSMDDYEKLNEKISSRKIFFGEQLSEKLFLKNDSELIEKFFYYSKRYIKKHELDNYRTKSIHIEKARKEIYGIDYEKLIRLEPIEKQFELEIDLRKKEMSTMTDIEKEKIKKEILDNLTK